ncbi:hypothetical protein KAFR_0D01190 [Kazachstania africana CBS 2517]|uniref:Dolichyl-phosphate-mannose--protein mannosyltransferase n=1 Tax=Kazachstania africana (strain ATCC 22294 / BCRC 22015 / CBS 2517 / CECT 1963 / NBRC 1671 / NRRL Y-8276) TaxID=1071382 RepID=H2ATR5_KAZAF|nr:hypothetical protein KAFR_0D01190 [Kazachstania africana CBS 2517]CCF57765.1 hypothetical protein KAFR_0D01190 [Kazachstania africana CBS 2517]
MSSTGYEATPAAKLKSRKSEKINDTLNSSDEIPEEEEEDYTKLTKSDKNGLLRFESIVMPIIFTALALFVRMYKIGINDHVVWDEAHFGKFGSYYLRHEFYHDVHPPLGKMLVGLSGYLAGYNGSWDFPSGEPYPDYIDYVKMRIFNASFSALCVPIAYFTAKEIGFSLPVVWLFTSLVLFENSFTTLGRFILLDSMLLFFTVLSFFAFVKFHNQRSHPFSLRWWKWLAITGISLGCAISVKMVGLFVITLVGIYTVIDLWSFLGDKKMSWKTYINHWLARIVCLIVFPFLVFLLCFKIHFILLSHSGTGDSNMPSLFQARLIGTEVGQGPRDIALRSSILSIKNQALGGSLLHSHVQTFPEGSKQQQVTCYGYSDSNNDWFFDLPRALTEKGYRKEENDTNIEYIEADGIYRLVHKNTGRNLHTHPVQAPVTKSEWEVSAYGDANIGDAHDDWLIEIVDQRGSENKTRLHPLTSSFRIKSVQLGCYLAQTGNHLPEWGFRQSEVACLKNPFKRDKRTWWNIETHENSLLPPRPDDFEYPKTNFLKDFIHLNLAMMATNNALIPDSEKFDTLGSSAWEWPSLHVGLRMCGWGDENIKYYLLGTPASTWASTIAVLGCMVTVVVLFLRWNRQMINFKSNKDLNTFMMGAFYPLLCWGLHYMPFVIMSRVTYVHHYLPALYFALIILAYAFDAFLQLCNMRAPIKWLIFISYFAAVVACFYYFSPISFGMVGPISDYEYLNWLSSWTIVRDDRKG